MTREQLTRLRAALAMSDGTPLPDDSSTFIRVGDLGAILDYIRALEARTPQTEQPR